MTTRIEVRSGTSAEWSAVNPILHEGEVGYDSTEDKIKVGDGTAQWSELAFQGGSGGGLAFEEVEFTFNNTIGSISPDFVCPIATLNPETHDIIAFGLKKHGTEWLTPISSVAFNGGSGAIGFTDDSNGDINANYAAFPPYFVNAKKTSDSTWVNAGTIVANGDKIIIKIIKTAK